MHSLNSKRILTTTSALFFMALLPVSALAADTVEKTPVLAKEKGLNEAAEQYLIHYASVSGVDGNRRGKIPPRSSCPMAKPLKAVGLWSSGRTAPWVSPTTARLHYNVRTDRDKQYLNTGFRSGTPVAPDDAGLGLGWLTSLSQCAWRGLEYSGWRTGGIENLSAA